MLNFEVLRKTEVLGLDIGTSAVKMVALHKDHSSYAVTSAAIAEIAADNDLPRRGLDTAGNDLLKINTIRAINECLKSSGTRRKWAVCGVSGPDVAVRDFEFPPLAADEIPGAVSLEASQVCPFNASDSPEGIGIDYQLIPTNTGTDENFDNGPGHPIRDKTRGILVAATNSLIKSKVQLAREAGLKCVLMDIDGLALLNCFNELDYENEKSRDEQTIAILNAGASHMTIAISPKQVRDQGPFIRDMAYAGDEIIEQIAAEKNMQEEAVKEILFPDVHRDSRTGKTGLYQSLEKVGRKVTADIAETLRFYSAQVKSNSNYTGIDKLYVCGGFALAAGFIELLNEQLGIEAVLWNPFENMRFDILRPGSPVAGPGRENQKYREFLSERGAAFAVAAGLAMRSI
jgi:type IV pilus assembly protein PilM